MRCAVEAKSFAAAAAHKDTRERERESLKQKGLPWFRVLGTPPLPSKPSYLPSCLPTYLLTYLPTSLPTYLLIMICHYHTRSILVLPTYPIRGAVFLGFCGVAKVVIIHKKI
jgi:hypothetical protein